jgi:hypothetical protein
MFLQRLSDSQILTDVPIQNVSEAVWHSFSNFGLSNVVIDLHQNKVTGTTGMTLTSYGKTFTASFESHTDGLLITLRGEAHLYGTLEFGRGKAQIIELGNIVESHLERAAQRPEEYSRATYPTPVVPIASLFGGPQIGTVAAQPPMIGIPIYGVASAPKRGLVVLTYGIFGIVDSLHIFAPVSLFYGLRALREYKEHDPGDKIMVQIGLILGAIGTCLLINGPLMRLIRELS